MKILLGKNLTGSSVFLDFFTMQSGLLITGRTRSGKSSFLYQLLSELAPNPAVRLAGIDPTGLIFAPLSEDDFRCSMLTDDDQLSAVAVMTGLVQLMQERMKELLREKRDKFADFSPEFPLIVCVVDEFPALLFALSTSDKARKPAERLESRFLNSLLSLIVGGQKVGIKVVVVSQQGSVSALSGGGSLGSMLRDSLGIRVSFAQDSQGFSMLHGDISPEQLEEGRHFPPGVAFLEGLPDRPAELVRLTASYTRYADYVEAMTAG